MAASNSIRSIQDFVNKMPLKEITNTAEIVVKYIPTPINTAVDIIIKVLKLMQDLMPAADQALDAAAQIADNTVEMKEKIAAAKENTISPERKKFNTLLNIAAADGDITPAEKEYLQVKAQEAGIDADELEMLILSKL